MTIQNAHNLINHMLSKKIFYMSLLCGFLIVCWAYNVPAADKPKDQQRPSGIHRIVIDPGFGGKELGAPGYTEGIYSKDINLQIAKKSRCGRPHDRDSAMLSVRSETKPVLRRGCCP